MKLNGEESEIKSNKRHKIMSLFIKTKPLGFKNKKKTTDLYLVIIFILYLK